MNVKHASIRHAVCNVIIVAAVFLASPLGAQAQPAIPTIHFAAIADPLEEAGVYAIEANLVHSNKVRVEYIPLPVPGLLEALNAHQYEIIQAGVTLIPKIVASGAPIRIVGLDFTSIGDMKTYGILVRSDSGIRSFGDLRGHSLAVDALGATNTFQMRAVLRQKFGIDTFQGKRDLDLKQVPQPTMPTLLHDKDVDAAYVNYATLYRLRDDPEFRNLGSPQKAFSEAFKARALIAVKVSFAPILAEKGAEIKAAVDLLEESRKYYEAHQQEIDAAVAKKYNVDPAYLAWSHKNTVIGGPLEPVQLAKDLQAVWSVAAEFGEISNVPDIRTLIWKP
jgi:ABC-type nitrate/sulfonate/bicarbonate transport system substrate-binding protein